MKKYLVKSGLKGLFLIIFLILFALRILPELLTIYPIGQDTQQYLVGAKQFKVIRRINKFYPYPILYKILGLLYCSGVDVVNVMKIFPAIIYGVLGIAILLFCVRHLNWNRSKSFMAALIIGLSPVTLRISFELHHQFLSLIFLMILLCYFHHYLEDNNVVKSITFLTGVFCLGLTHWLTSATLLFILLTSGITDFLLGNRYHKRILKIGVAFITLLFSCLLAYYEITSPFRLSVRELIFATYIASHSRSSVWLFSLFLYSYWAIFPLAVVGVFKDKYMLSIICFSLIGILFWLFTGKYLFLPPERYIWPLIIPLGIFATNGIYRIQQLKPLNRIKFSVTLCGRKLLNVKIVKTILLFTLMILIIWHSLSLMELMPRPPILGPPPYTFPGTILYNGVFSKEMGALKDTIEQIKDMTSPDNVCIAYYSISGWIYYYTNCQVLRVGGSGNVFGYLIMDSGTVVYKIETNNVSNALKILRRMGFSQIIVVDLHDRVNRLLPDSTKTEAMVIYEKEPLKVMVIRH